MRLIKILGLSCLIFASACYRQESMQELSDRVFTLATSQLTTLASGLDDSTMPRTVEDGTLRTGDLRWWCSGFFPGSLWYVYEYTGSEAIKELALEQTLKLDQVKYLTAHHDIGFMIGSSYGNALRLTGEPSYKEVLHTAAHSLITRYNPIVGCTRSWDNNKWSFPVIIDNMMNLELLLKVAKLCDEPELEQIALRHARTTMANHFRPDYSSFHLVDFDPQTGEVLGKQTVQGYADNSSWSRGQAWGLYGFTMMYEQTALDEFRMQAENIAKMIVSRLPQDGIPYWDFDAPISEDGVEPLRDASAATIMASAFVKLAELTANSEYLKVAEKQLRTLASDAYLCAEGECAGFLLKHSVGNLPGDGEVDVPLSYADYYFLEALIRYSNTI